MHPFHILILLFVLLALAGFGFVVRRERARYLKAGKAAGWLRVRLATLPIALVSAAIAWLPARAASGMESLAVFFAMLLLVVPLFWFGAHWLVGRTASPPLDFGESAAIAALPLLYALAAAYLAHALQAPAWLYLRGQGLA